MSFVNFSTKEITSKIVYYGPGLCGKTTTLQYIHDSIVPENKGQIVSLATDVDRTIYFDFLPLRLGKIQSFSVRIQLYTVPGQVRYNSTRKLVLSGTDGVVFVADSQADLLDENVKSWRNLVENLRGHGLALDSLPHVLQYNKRDLSDLSSVGELNRALNPHDAPWFETCATTGEGVLEGLKTVSKLVMQDLSRKGVVNRHSRSGGRSRHESATHPLVGLAALHGGPLGPLAVLEEMDEVLDLPREPAPGSLAARAAAPAAAAPVPEATAGRGPSFAALLDDPAATDRLSRLELHLEAGDSAEIQRLAREIFFGLIEDNRFFPPDMTESSRISMLGISLRKYAHFYRLLSQPRIDRAEGLFLLHFLVDVHFGKGMP